jgi:hypothetical protein
VQDAAGNPIRTSGVTVTAAIADGSGSLSGQRSRTTGSDGRATFTDLAIMGAVGTHSIIFASPGLTSVTSNGIDVNPAETTTEILSDESDPSAPGEGVTVRIEVASPGSTPTGEVVVSASSSESCSATLAEVRPSVAQGQCTITLTAEGNRVLTARYAGSDLFTSSSDTEPHSVIQPDLPPTAVDDGYSATGGVPLSVPASEGVLANDSDPDGDPLTASLEDSPKHGSLLFRNDGSFEYLAGPGNWGEDEFTYLATARSASAMGTVTIIVSRGPP